MNNITPAWLTNILHQAGALPQGEVIAVEERQSDAFNSQLAFLQVAYSADTLPALPTRFVLKRNIDADWAIEAGAEEVKFYKLVTSLPDHPPVLPPCYAAAYDEASGSSYLLLADLSASHAPPETREQEINIAVQVLSPESMVRVIDTLAQFHAYWWQHPLLESGQLVIGYWLRNAERFGLYLERRQRSWDNLIAAEQDWLPADIRTLYEHLLATLPAYWEEHLARRFNPLTHLTVMHGDSYFANFLCPKPGESGNTYLLDWQSPGVGLAGYDLVNLLATFWTSEQRRSEGREQALLQRYYATLCANGVKDYTWGDLLLDYRHGLIFWLLMPVQDCYGGAGKDYWWPKMQCLVAAFRDWECERLLAATEVYGRGFR